MSKTLAKQAVLVATLLLFSVPLTSGAQQSGPSRKGMTDVAPIEVKSMVGKILEDPRYDALRRVAYERGLRLTPGQAIAKDYAEGYQALFIPALDRDGIEKGFLANSGAVWTLSLRVGGGPTELPEGYIAKVEENGRVSVEVGNMTRPGNTDDTLILDKSISWACQYVKSTGFNFGCFALPDNAFGQYYTTYYRYGTIPDIMSTSWWVCYKGIPHNCPVTESPGSPYIWVSCGAPPDHPEG